MKKKLIFTVLFFALTTIVFSDIQWNVLHTDYAKKMIVDDVNHFYSINQIGVWKSTDEGETWIQTSYDSPPRDGHNTMGGATVTTDGILVGALDNGVYYSSDYGNTWVNTFSTGYGTGSRRMIPLGNSALMSYGGSLRGIYKWNPVSSSWYQTFTHSSDFFDFVQIPNGDIYATAGSPNHIGGVYKSTDNGENWSLVLETQYYDNCKTIDFYNGVLYYLSNNNEFWKSNDYGANWTLVSTLSQLSSTYITEDMYIAPNGTIFTSFGADNGVLFSTDFGVTWNFLNTGLPSLNVLDFTFFNNNLYVGTQSGLCVLDGFNFSGLTSNFSADSTSGYIPLTVNFTDESVPQDSIITWQWDFENDGTYDSFIQNPTFIYTYSGIYSVKLKVNNVIQADSLIKYNYITVEYVPPAPPTNVQVEIIEPDAVITWTAVDTTIFGDPITPDGYIVKYNEMVDDEHFWFLAFTTETTHTHEFVAQYSTQMFYKVIAIVNYTREQIEYLESINNSREKVKWSDVKRNFNVIRK